MNHQPKPYGRHPISKPFHLNINENASAQICQCQASIYSSAVTEFPLGIQMCLVPELWSSTTWNTHKTVTNLQSLLQASFLAETEMPKIYIQQPSKLNKSQLYTPLRALLRKAIYPIKPTQQLIHAISLLVKQEGFLICYLHQYQILAHAAIIQVPKQ